MSHRILSPPAGLLSDEDVVDSPILESTAADLRSVVRKDLLSDCSVISASLEDKQALLEDTSEKVKVYLRIRPFLTSELDRQEDQGCVCIENTETLVLQAPKDSFALKSNERELVRPLTNLPFPRYLGQKWDRWPSSI